MGDFDTAHQALCELPQQDLSHDEVVVMHSPNSTDSGSLASNENVARIGLGRHKHVETLEVKWPSGRVQTWSQFPAGGKYALIRGQKESSGLTVGWS